MKRTTQFLSVIKWTIVGFGAISFCGLIFPWLNNIFSQGNSGTEIAALYPGRPGWVIALAAILAIYFLYQLVVEIKKELRGRKEMKRLKRIFEGFLT